MTSYQATLESLSSHPLPEWYAGAKLGIFIHWGVFAIPAWAPVWDIHDLINGKIDSAGNSIAYTPYAEWYPNSIKTAGSPAQQHHQETYGADYPYDAFVPQFQKAAQGWEAEPWASLFEGAGARYVVLVTKHHDGFVLWPSAREPFRQGYRSTRDYVGELSQAVRGRGMRMGLYYSGGLDWTFDGTPLRHPVDVLVYQPQTQAYADYVLAHWRELIDRYQPALLWNDIGFPTGGRAYQLFAEYYQRVPDGVVNDRWSNLGRQGVYRLLRRRPVRALLAKLFDLAARRRMIDFSNLPYKMHHDFRTPEYASFEQIVGKKWESTRGIGKAFGYNQNEPADSYLSAQELIHSFVDIVSKNGNLLLNVGPMADGTIPEIQRERLQQLGDWLRINGDAIYDTQYWSRAEGVCSAPGGEIPVRFTQKGPELFATLLGTPAGREIELVGLRAQEETQVQLLGHGEALEWRQEHDRLQLTLPDHLPSSIAHSLRIRPQAQDLGEL